MDGLRPSSSSTPVVEKVSSHYDVKYNAAAYMCSETYRYMLRKVKEIVPDIPITLLGIENNPMGAPPSGMKREYSISRRHLDLEFDISQDQIGNIMFDKDTWISTFSNMVYRVKERHLPEGFIEYLKETDEDYMAATMFYAELRFASPLVRPRKCKFLRFQKHLACNEAYCIIDVPFQIIPYMHSERAQDYVRRASGVFYWPHRDYNLPSLTVVWVEEVQVFDDIPSIFDNVINSGAAFGAERWISGITWKIRRDESTLSQYVGEENPAPRPFDVHPDASDSFLFITAQMKKGFMEWTKTDPDPCRFELFCDEAFRYKSIVDGVRLYVVRLNFRVAMSLDAVFDYLLHEQTGSKLVPRGSTGTLIRLTSAGTDSLPGKERNIIALKSNETTEDYYELVEASRDSLCGFVIIGLINEQVLEQILERKFFDTSCRGRPRGWAVVADGLYNSIVTYLKSVEFPAGTLVTREHLEIDEIIISERERIEKGARRR